MRVPGELTPKQEALIAALLTEPTQVAAAAKANVGEATLYRWMHEPAFARAYRAARRAQVETALGQLQRSAEVAVATLERNLTCGIPSNEVRAALGVLSQAVKAIELLDMEERLAALEARLGVTTP